MLSASKARAALDALFDAPAVSPAVAPAAPPPPAPELPRNLDDAIEADTRLAWDGAAFRWFAGRDAGGIVRIFRFQRGLPLEQWHALLRTQALVAVSGPYRNQALAARA
jgi:hypothetical protein